MFKNVARITPLLLSTMVTACTVTVTERNSNSPPPPPPPPTATTEATTTKPATTGRTLARVKQPVKLRRHKFLVKDNKIELPGPILFEAGSDQILPESDYVLEHVHDYLKAKPQVTLMRIEGHTDTDGDDAGNLLLSQRRAMAVSRWLTAKGVDCKRLLPVGFGETRLVVNPEETEEDRAMNRRVVFINAHIKGKPIANFPADGNGISAGDPCDQ